MNARPADSRPARPADCRAGGRLAVLLGALALALAPTAGASGPEASLDARGWELVSPPEKNGGEVATPAEAGAGGFRAAAQGGAFAFASAASFGQAAGAAPFSQYLSVRGAGGWSTENLTPPLLSGTYAANPYLLFSVGLSRAIVSGGELCREGGEQCGAENPPLGPGGPPGYRNLYLRQADTYTPLLTTQPASVSAEDFRLHLGGASPDLGHVVFSSCAKLSAEALEVPAVPGPGCEEAEQNLYLWSEGEPLRAVNLLPGQVLSDPGAAMPAAEGAVSADGSRVYWHGAEGNLYLREATQTVQVDAAAGGGGAFEAASLDGSVAFFAKAGQLYRYDAVAETAQLLASGVGAVLDASADGSRLFYLTAAGPRRWRQGAGTLALAAYLGSFAVSPPQATAATADGARLFFTSPDPLRSADTNNRPDAYQWAEQGSAGCANAFGCVGLISSGRIGAATFLDASADGADAYFLADASLVGADPGALDVYDARLGGGFAEPATPTPCVADACQGPPLIPAAIAPSSSLFADRDGNLAPRPKRRPCRKQAAKRRKAAAGSPAKKKKKRRRCARRRGGRR